MANMRCSTSVEFGYPLANDRWILLATLAVTMLLRQASVAEAVAVGSGSEGARKNEPPPRSFSLHYTTAGDVTDVGELQMAGLYSGRLSLADHGSGWPIINNTFSNLRNLDFGCARVDNTIHSDLEISSISFDNASHDVLLVGDVMGQINVMRGHLCQRQNMPCIGVAEWPKLPCILCRIATMDQGLLGAFALDDHKIYFIFIPDHTDHHSQLKHHKVLQLRILTGCEHRYPIFNRLEVDDCSQVLAAYTSSSHHLQPASDLTVINFGTEGSKYFITQARTYDWNDQARTNYDHVGMVLVSFHLVNQKAAARVHLLHDEDLPIPFLNLPLSNIGGIGIYMRTICWSVFDRIYCAQMNDNGRNLLKKTLVLEPGRASSVCEGQDANITTGVALVHARMMKEMTLVFGCSARTTGEGGAGLLHMKVVKNQSKVVINKVTDSHGPVLAGSMSIMGEFTCPPKDNPNWPPDMHSPAGAATSSICVVFVLMAALLTLLRGY